MTNNYTLYTATSPSGKIYVGITSNFNRRFATHKHTSKKGTTKFNKAIRKYGIENLKWSILCKGMTKNEACKLETKTIKRLNTLKAGYNSTEGGEGTIGYVSWNKGLKGELSHVYGAKNGRYNKPVSKETRAKIAKANKGKTCSEASKKASSKLWKGATRSESSREALARTKGTKPFEVFKEGLSIGIWKSYRSCARDLNLDHKRISKCVKTKSLTETYSFKEL